ncbi:ATP-binding protein [Vagococcus carniphilus]|uniref:ATP-binding protein n=1 Tax=Vagococcus carniphilus TaxID=218144 RepID=UPI00288FEEC8|nr:ATP-binding protein [Vagococcus carniphilus]MDT2830046.1 ATP-binding protein [Vagococcus carniphilus]MDT2838480.1 ATP-binding protein [Vagococcus carniphilus]MDT2855642.1 ATP-binding protein [Vagococcus carniphilus]
MDFPLLNSMEQTNDICEKHQIKLSKLKNREPFCTECHREKLKLKEKNMLDTISKNQHLRRTIQTLEKDSILGDVTLWNATFDNYIADNEETAHALREAKLIAGDYVDRDRHFNTLFSGVPGVGKSHLAMAILKEVNESFDPEGSCLFISITDVLRLVKDSFNNPDSKYTENNMINLLTKVDLLVIDDFGSESSFQKKGTESSEYNQRFLFNILNARTRTIVTTNLNSDELLAIYNPKIISRLFRGVEGHVIKFTDATEDKRSNFSF